MHIISNQKRQQTYDRLNASKKMQYDKIENRAHAIINKNS